MENTWPWRVATMPWRQLTSAGRDAEVDVRPQGRLPRHRQRAPDLGRRGREDRAAVGPQHHVGVECGDQRVEVTHPRRSQERLDHLALGADVDVRRGGPGPDAPPGPAGQLARRLRGAVDKAGDLLERNAEHVVQHEGEPLGEGASVSSTTSRASPTESAVAPRARGSTPSARSMIGSGRCGVQQLPPRRTARERSIFSEHPRDDGRRPPRRGSRSRPVRSRWQPQPGLLHRVFRLAHRAQHPVGDRPQ